MISIRNNLIFISILLATTTSLLMTLCVVDAVKPADLPCTCENGGVRNSSVSTYCACSGCPSPWVQPYCSFKSTDRVRFAITYRNNTGNAFSFDKAEDKIRKHFGVDGDSVKWIQRFPQNEASIAEVVVVYLISGKYVNDIVNDVYLTPRPTYLTNPEAQDIWEVGKVIAPASPFSKHFAKGNELGSFQISGNKVSIVDSYLEFYIAALAVVLFCPIFEAVLGCVFKSSPEELDKQEEKWKDHDKMKDDPDMVDYSQNNNNAAEEWEMKERNRRAQELQKQGLVSTTTTTTKVPATPPTTNIYPSTSHNPLTPPPNNNFHQQQHHNNHNNRGLTGNEATISINAHNVGVVEEEMRPVQDVSSPPPPLPTTTHVEKQHHIVEEEQQQAPADEPGNSVAVYSYDNSVNHQQNNDNNDAHPEGDHHGDDMYNFG